MSLGIRALYIRSSLEGGPTGESLRVARIHLDHVKAKVTNIALISRRFQQQPNRVWRSAMQNRLPSNP